MPDEQYVELHDATGKLYTCQILDVIEFQGKSYALLLHKDAAEDGPIVFLRLEEKNGGTVFCSIEDNEEFEEIVAFVEELARAAKDK